MENNDGLVTLATARLRQPLVDRLVEALELCPEDARVTVDHLLRSEQSGKSSHGLIRVSYTTTSGKFGPYGSVAAPAPQPSGPGRLHTDGAGHFGYPVLHKLIEAGCEEADKRGTCVATSPLTYPTGALGDWARQAGLRGTGVVLVASSPRRVAPPGGTHPVIGTNAICIGLPTEPLPFVADCATSEITHGKLLLARVTGKPLPPLSAVGPDGQPTTDPAKVIPTEGIGALLPAGGSHKAFAIAMGIELLANLGGGLPGEALAGRHGVFCLFLGPSVLRERMPMLSAWLQTLDREGTRIPGWTSGRRAVEHESRGVVAINDDTHRALSALLPAEVLAECRKDGERALADPARATPDGQKGADR